MIYRSVYRNVRGWAWTRDCLLSKPDNIGCFAVQLWFFSWIVLQTTTKWLLACFVLVFSPYSLHRAMLVVCNYTVESSRVAFCWAHSRPDNYWFVDPFILYTRPAARPAPQSMYSSPTKNPIRNHSIPFNLLCCFLKWYVSSKWRRWEMVAVL